MSDTVYTFTKCVKIHIRHRPINEEFPYDWFSDGGEESRYRFVTQEDAVADAENFFS